MEFASPVAINNYFNCIFVIWEDFKISIRPTLSQRLAISKNIVFTCLQLVELFCTCIGFRT